MEGRKTYVCKRPGMCEYLMSKGFTPYRITASRENPKFDVFLFTSTPELYKEVIAYTRRNQK